MPIVVDGVTIQDCDGVIVDGTPMDNTYADNISVHESKCCSDGYVEVHFSTALGDTQYVQDQGGGAWKFTVPQNITHISVCAQGGGGSGGSDFQPTHKDSNPGGGECGKLTQRYLSVTEGSVLNIQIGRGGQPVVCVTEGYPVQGNAGEATWFDNFYGLGGQGGYCNHVGTDPYYNGNGENSTGCTGAVHHNGTKWAGTTTAACGGQASSFGHGGDGRIDTNAGNGGLAAGGGGGLGYTQNTWSGAGGDGVVYISWTC